MKWIIGGFAGLGLAFAVLSVAAVGRILWIAYCNSQSEMQRKRLESELTVRRLVLLTRSGGPVEINRPN